MTGDLGPTAAYAERLWSWAPRTGGETDDRLGTLTILQRKGVTARAAAEVDSYGVQEDTEPTNTPPCCRAFLLLNDEDWDQPDVYLVTVGVRQLCTCTAAKFGKDCKHSAALTALVDAGVI